MYLRPSTIKPYDRFRFWVNSSWLEFKKAALGSLHRTRQQTLWLVHVSAARTSQNQHSTSVGDLLILAAEAYYIKNRFFPADSSVHYVNQSRKRAEATFRVHTDSSNYPAISFPSRHLGRVINYSCFLWTCSVVLSNEKGWLILNRVTVKNSIRWVRLIEPPLSKCFTFVLNLHKYRNNRNVFDYSNISLTNVCSWWKILNWEEKWPRLTLIPTI